MLPMSSRVKRSLPCEYCEAYRSGRGLHCPRVLPDSPGVEPVVRARDMVVAHNSLLQCELTATAAAGPHYRRAEWPVSTSVGPRRRVTPAPGVVRGSPRAARGSPRMIPRVPRAIREVPQPIRRVPRTIWGGTRPLRGVPRATRKTFTSDPPLDIGSCCQIVDFDGDGDVDLKDVAAFQSAFGG